jgi:hypothetical protein
MRLYPGAKKDDEQTPARITPAQWILVCLPVAIAAAGYEVTSYNALALITQLLAAFNFVLLAFLVKEALGTRVVGKVCLVGGVFIFYWVEALNLSFQRNPFSIAEGFPINASQFDQDLIVQALVYITVFQLLLFVGYSVRLRISGVVAYVASRVDSLSFDRSLVGLLLALCAVMPLLIYCEFDYDKVVAALLASRSATDFDAPEAGLSQHLALFGLYGAALFFVYALKTSTWRRFWWLLLGVIAAIPFVSGGTRHLWLYISLPSLLIILRGFKGRLNSYRLLGPVAVVFVVLLVAQAQFVYRTVGWKEVGSVDPEELTAINNTGQFTAQLFAQYLVPVEHPYFRELIEPYFVIHWVPRQFWPDKPIMESWAYYNESYARGAAYNVTPSVIGQFHLNWGFPGVVFIGAWLGFLSFVADRVLMSLNPDRQRAMFVVVGMFYAFIISSFRFYSPIYFSYFVFGVLAMLLLTRRRRFSNTLAPFAPLTDGEALPQLSEGSWAR